MLEAVLAALFPPSERRELAWVILGSAVILFASNLAVGIAARVRGEEMLALGGRSLVVLAITALATWLVLRAHAPYGVVVFSALSALLLFMQYAVIAFAVGAEYGGFNPLIPPFSLAIETLAKMAGVVLGASLSAELNGLNQSMQDMRAPDVWFAMYCIAAAFPVFVVSAVLAWMQLNRAPGTHLLWWGELQLYLPAAVALIATYLLVRYARAPQSVWAGFATAPLARVAGDVAVRIAAPASLLAMGGLARGYRGIMLTLLCGLVGALLGAWERERHSAKLVVAADAVAEQPSTPGGSHG